MKKIILLIITIFLINLVSAEVTNNNYAVEVVLNKPGTNYNLYNMGNLEDITIKDNKYITSSEYNPNLASILFYEHALTSGKQEGLSVRLQLPTKIQETNLPYLKFISTIIKKEINISDEFYNNWEITCSTNEYLLKKQRTTISIIKISKDRYEITIETYDNLAKTGVRCFSKYKNTICITQELKRDIEDILTHIGLISSFNNLFLSYNIINIGNRIIKTLIPSTTLKPDWKEAMRQELVRLRKKGIIEIPDSDIEEIVSLTEQGKAGINSRIIYDENLKAYNYYYKTTLPILKQETDTKPFIFPINQEVDKSTDFISKLYYLIPIILAFILLIIFIILIIIARILAKAKKKPKLITTLLSQPQT